MPRSSGGRSLILVDELAHTNVPGSRHPKRYHDVEELLDAGIDVYTTVNIQHIESLNDVVAQITRVRVREIVPDCDPRPRRRHRAGRPDARRPDPAPEGRQGLRPQAGRAGAQALLLAGQSDGAARAGAAPHRRARRRAAARADAGARHPGAVGGGRAHSRLRQRGSALCGARALRQAPGRSPARAVDRAVARDAGAACSSARRRGIASPRPCGWPSGSTARPSRSPPRRGASPTTSSASRSKNNVTHIIIGKSTRSRWFEILHGSVVHDLVRRAGNISVHVIAGEELGGAGRRERQRWRRTPRRPFDPLPYVVALLAVAAALGVSLLLRPLLGIENVDLDLPDGDRRHRRPLRACGRRCWPASPRRSATTSSSCRRSTPSPSPIRPMSRPSCCSRCSSVVVSNLAARGRTQTVAAHERVRSVESLYAFSRKLAGVGTLDDVLWATALSDRLDAQGARRAAAAGERLDRASRPAIRPRTRSTRPDLAAAKWAWEKNRPAGRDSDTLPGAKWLFLPMRTGRGADRHRRHRQRRAGPAAARRAAAAARCADRPGRAGDRARASRRGHRPGQARSPRRTGCARRCSPRSRTT